MQQGIESFHCASTLLNFPHLFNVNMSYCIFLPFFKDSMFVCFFFVLFFSSVT